MDALERELAAILAPRFSWYGPIRRNFERYQQAATSEGVVVNFLDVGGEEEGRDEAVAAVGAWRSGTVSVVACYAVDGHWTYASRDGDGELHGHIGMPLVGRLATLLPAALG